MLVLEGPDMVGKSTIASVIQRVFGTRIDKFGLPEASYVGTAPWQARYNATNVADRFWISEIIYGIVCRGKCNLTPEMAAQMIAWHRRMVVRTIVTVATPEAYELLLEKFYDPGREAFSVDQCRAVNEAYYNIFVNQDLWQEYDIYHLRPSVMLIHKIDAGIMRPDSGRYAEVVQSWIDERPAIRFNDELNTTVTLLEAQNANSAS